MLIAALLISIVHLPESSGAAKGLTLRERNRSKWIANNATLADWNKTDIFSPLPTISRIDGYGAEADRESHLSVKVLLIDSAFNTGCEDRQHNLDQMPTKKPNLTNQEICRNFTLPSSTKNSSDAMLIRQEFTTPYFPGRYPPNVQCIRIIRATAKGRWIISLDFRRSFAIEADSHGLCSYDFIEVRDGPFGFSPLIGRFCGQAFPPIATAYSGSMWIYFRSDATLEYSGFSAVVAIAAMPPTSDLPVDLRSSDELSLPACKFELSQMDGIITAKSMRQFYGAFLSPNMTFLARNSSSLASTSDVVFECVWHLLVAQEFQIRLIFQTFDLAFPNECALNFLEVYQSNTAASQRLRFLCGRTASNVALFASEGYVRMLMTRAALANVDAKIEIIFAAYTHRTLCAKEGMFDCGDDSCVPRELVCNGRPSCFYGKDEQDCNKNARFSLQFVTGPYLAILVIILTMIAIIIGCATILNLCPSLKQPRKPQVFGNSLDRPVSGAADLLSPTTTMEISISTDFLNNGQSNSVNGQIDPLLISFASNEDLQKHLSRDVRDLANVSVIASPRRSSLRRSSFIIRQPANGRQIDAKEERPVVPVTHRLMKRFQIQRESESTAVTAQRQASSRRVARPPDLVKNLVAAIKRESEQNQQNLNNPPYADVNFPSRMKRTTSSLCGLKWKRVSFGDEQRNGRATCSRSATSVDFQSFRSLPHDGSSSSCSNMGELSMDQLNRLSSPDADSEFFIVSI